MKNKINLSVCILIALLITLQCNISVYALDEENNIKTIEQKDNAMPETEIVNENKELSDTNTEIINGAEDLSVHAFTQDDQMQ